MVSRLPVFSGKRVGKRVPPEMVLPVFVVVVLVFALLIAYPWEVLSIGAIVYLGCLPLGWLSHQRIRPQGCAGCWRVGFVGHAGHTGYDRRNSTGAAGRASDPSELTW